MNEPKQNEVEEASWRKLLSSSTKRGSPYGSKSMDSGYMCIDKSPRSESSFFTTARNISIDYKPDDSGQAEAQRQRCGERMLLARARTIKGNQ